MGFLGTSGAHVELMGAEFIDFDPASETITMRFVAPARPAPRHGA